jgi:hypothetical protein
VGVDDGGLLHDSQLAVKEGNEQIAVTVVTRSFGLTFLVPSHHGATGPGVFDGRGLSLFCHVHWPITSRIKQHPSKNIPCTSNTSCRIQIMHPNDSQATADFIHVHIFCNKPHGGVRFRGAPNGRDPFQVLLVVRAFTHLLTMGRRAKSFTLTERTTAAKVQRKANLQTKQ